MGSQVSKSAFKAKALELLRKVEESGDPLVITDHGRPALEVRPFRDTARSPFEVLRGSVKRYEAPTEPVEDDWDANQ